RPSGGSESSARASTSAFITMPGPPPAGVSSTVRWRSVAWSRILTASSDHRESSALPARLMPSGPGNISGNKVSTLARHRLIRSVSLFCVFVLVLVQVLGFVVFAVVARRRIDDDTAGRDIDLRHRLPRERHQQRPARHPTNLDHVAGAEIMDG